MTSITEKIRIMCIKRGNITMRKLSKLLGISAQNLSNKLGRDSYKVRDLQEIADALGYELSIKFIDKETGEEI